MGKIILNDADKNHIGFLFEITEFNKHAKPSNIVKIKQKWDTYESIYALYDDREMYPNAFKSGMFPLLPTEGTGLKIWPTDFIFLKAFSSYIKVWFTDWDSNPLKIEDRKNLTFVIK